MNDVARGGGARLRRFFCVVMVLLLVTVCGLALNPVVTSDLHTI